MRLLALNGRYFGKTKWDPMGLSAVSRWGRVLGGVVVGLQGVGG